MGVSAVPVLRYNAAKASSGSQSAIERVASTRYNAVSLYAGFTVNVVPSEQERCCAPFGRNGSPSNTWAKTYLRKVAS